MFWKCCLSYVDPFVQSSMSWYQLGNNTKDDNFTKPQNNFKTSQTYKSSYKSNVCVISSGHMWRYLHKLPVHIASVQKGIKAIPLHFNSFSFFKDAIFSLVWTVPKACIDTGFHPVHTLSFIILESNERYQNDRAWWLFQCLNQKHKLH